MRPVIPVLAITLIASSMALVYVRYQSRLAFADLHQLDTERDALNVEYGRLLLERATWSLQDVVEREATTRLDMSRPESSNVVTLVVPATGAR
ncbi:MAG: hypothetical protein DHS20C01_06610 [marine bacterium B5-7]|nr:MAG: hypothetical protein DHS20C01_06610 [marine bacterium B5-7]